MTLFPGEGPRTVFDQLSREPESLARSLAATLRGIYHPKAVMAFDAILLVGPEHARVFSEAGWDKAQLLERLHELCAIPADELLRGAGGMAEGIEGPTRAETVPKFRPGGIHIVHCGGSAGLFSAVIPGWVGGGIGSQVTLKEIQS